MSTAPPAAALTARELRARVWSRLRPYRGTLALALGLLVLSVPFVNFHPLVWGFVADRLVEETLTPGLLAIWLGIMLGTYLIGLVLSAWQSYLLERTGQAFVRDIRQELFAKFQRQSLGYHRDHATGELVTRMTGDVDAMEQSVLQGLSFEVDAGAFVAIAGGSGSGKSTLLNLVPRFYDVDSGAVVVDDHDVRDFTLASLRAEIGYVGQDNALFAGTVEENLRYGRPAATAEEVREAARAANADDFIRGLPAGYQTEVGQNGVKLSGGQRQRLCLARAFLTRPRILLLDEPTAAVEPESEALIHASIIERTRAGRGTTLLVTHRVDLLRQAPRILFLQQGRLVGDGRHDELVETCPEYADAYHRWEVRQEVAASRDA